MLCDNLRVSCISYFATFREGENYPKNSLFSFYFYLREENKKKEKEEKEVSLIFFFTKRPPMMVPFLLQQKMGKEMTLSSSAMQCLIQMAQ